MLVQLQCEYLHTDIVDPDLILSSGKAAYSNVCLSVHIFYVYLYLFYVCIYFRKPKFNVWSSSVRLSNGQVYVIFIFCIFVFIRTFENQFQIN